MQFNNPTSTDTSVLRRFSFLCLMALGAGAIGIRILGFETSLKLSALSPLKCPLAFLGLSCPTCGLGHSILHGLGGDWKSSFEWHPLGAVVIAVSLALSVVGVFFPSFLERGFKKVRVKSPRFLLVAIAILYLGWHLSRL